MSKAILVINKPKRCGDCELLEQYFSEENEEWYEKCIANHRMYIVDTEKIHERCPLKPIPQLVNELDLEIWNSTKGQILAPKGTFDEIYEE